MNYFYQGKGYDHYTQLPSFITKEKLLDIYFSMLRMREIEWEIVKRYPEDEMKTPVHLAIGHEASVSGICAVLTNKDKTYCGHRTHGVYLGKGGSLDKMLLELYGKAEGTSGSRGGSMYLIDPECGMDGVSAIVGGIVPIAAGAAKALKYRKEKNTVVVFLGDAAMEEGCVLETLNLAVLWKLPIIFVCENNFYSVCSPLHKRQPEVEIFEKARAFGLPALQVDGNNVLDVYKAANEALKVTMSGHGPYFIETKVYRWLSHVGHTDDTKSGYRSEGELLSWKENCPIKLLEEYLFKQKILDEDTKASYSARIVSEIIPAFERARRAPYPSPDTLLKHVYS